MPLLYLFNWRKSSIWFRELISMRWTISLWFKGIMLMSLMCSGDKSLSFWIRTWGLLRWRGTQQVGLLLGWKVSSRYYLAVIHFGIILMRFLCRKSVLHLIPIQKGIIPSHLTKRKKSAKRVTMTEWVVGSWKDKFIWWHILIVPLLFYPGLVKKNWKWWKPEHSPPKWRILSS